MLQDIKLYRRLRGGNWVKVKEKKIHLEGSNNIINVAALEYWIPEKEYRNHRNCYSILETESHHKKEATY